MNTKHKNEDMKTEDNNELAISPDPAIDAVWLEEAERRLAAHRAGKVTGIPVDEIFGPLSP